MGMKHENLIFDPDIWFSYISFQFQKEKVIDLATKLRIKSSAHNKLFYMYTLTSLIGNSPEPGISVYRAPLTVY